MQQRGLGLHTALLNSFSLDPEMDMVSAISAASSKSSLSSETGLEVKSVCSTSSLVASSSCLEAEPLNTSGHYSCQDANTAATRRARGKHNVVSWISN